MKTHVFFGFLNEDLYSFPCHPVTIWCDVRMKLQGPAWTTPESQVELEFLAEVCP